MTLPKSVGGRYELGELLGYGGMAEVHKGRDVRLGRDVAVKVLRADLARDPSFQNRFRREAQAAAGLNHPAIVAVYDTGEDRTATATEETVSPYIVMEYVEGGTLRDILKSEGQLPIQQAMEIVAEVCSALDFSHRSGIVHRDIKPGNVMITKAGAVKVMDFGIARALADNAATQTATAAVIGTAQYLSPEQARGESVDARSDVYSTGCLLYELVTGHPPFTGDSPVAIAYQHVRENPQIPSSVHAAIPRELDSIIMKALAKNPLNRYQTAAEMRSDLQRAVAGQRVEAEAVMTEADRTQFIATAPAVNRSQPRAAVIATDYDDEDDRGGHRGAIIWALVVVVLLAAIGGTGYFVLRKKGTPKPATVIVESYTNLSPGAAEDRIRAAGLLPPSNPLTISGPCTGGAAVTKGNVCTQSSAAGATLTKGQPLTFTIYGGPANVIVPQVTDLTLEQAQSQLNGLGLKANPTSVHSIRPAGTVLTQNPPGLTPVAPRGTVTLTVADGLAKLTNLVGRTYEDAKAYLNQGGWTNVQPAEATVVAPFKVGQVMSMNPAPGGYYDPTKLVTLTVATAAPTSTVPSCTPGASKSPGPSASPGPSTSSSASSGASGSPTPTC